MVKLTEEQNVRTQYEHAHLLKIALVLNFDDHKEILKFGWKHT